jgi:hypothetical protein
MCVRLAVHLLLLPNRAVSSVLASPAQGLLVGVVAAVAAGCEGMMEEGTAARPPQLHVLGAETRPCQQVSCMAFQWHWLPHMGWNWLQASTLAASAACLLGQVGQTCLDRTLASASSTRAAWAVARAGPANSREGVSYRSLMRVDRDIAFRACDAAIGCTSSHAVNHSSMLWH